MSKTIKCPHCGVVYAPDPYQHGPEILQRVIDGDNFTNISYDLRMSVLKVKKIFHKFAKEKYSNAYKISLENKSRAFAYWYASNPTAEVIPEVYDLRKEINKELEEKR